MRVSSRASGPGSSGSRPRSSFTRCRRAGLGAQRLLHRTTRMLESYLPVDASHALIYGIAHDGTRFWLTDPDTAQVRILELEVLSLFYDGFESGDGGAWSAVLPSWTPLGRPTNGAARLRCRWSRSTDRRSRCLRRRRSPRRSLECCSGMGSSCRIRIVGPRRAPARRRWRGKSGHRRAGARRDNPPFNKRGAGV